MQRIVPFIASLFYLLTGIFYLNSYAQPTPNDQRDTRAIATAMPAKAKAELNPKSDSKISGTVNFTETTNGLVVKYDLSGLKPEGMHGFHVHESGDCSSADAKSAGPHYKHIADTGGTSTDFPGRYAGDLPQIKADKDGKARGEFEVSAITVNKKNPIANRAIIVHGGPDDLTKKSAPRAACGVIKTTALK